MRLFLWFSNTVLSSSSLNRGCMRKLMPIFFCSLLFRSELAERETMLRTKAMREREEMKERRKYRFCLIRVRFPDGLVLQVTKITFQPSRDHCAHWGKMDDFPDMKLDNNFQHFLLKKWGKVWNFNLTEKKTQMVV